MKPLALNMSKMKKIAGDKEHSIFKHDDGHTMIIAHGKLPALQRKQLEKLPITEQEPKMAEGGKLDANARKHIANKNFALPDKRYPIEDASHARNALARVSQHGSPEEKSKV